MRRSEGPTKPLELATIGALALVVGLEACDRPVGSCGPGGVSVPLPSGEFAPASGELVHNGDSDSPLNETFPHGAYQEWPSSGQGHAGDGGGLAGSAGASSPSPEVDDVYGKGAYIPSARLLVDRNQGSVTRSYVDDQGRSVVESWRIKETNP